MADAIVTLTETVQLTFTVHAVQDYYWDMTGAEKVTPLKIYSDTIDTGKTYKVFYMDVPAKTTVIISHNTALDVDMFDQDRMAVYHSYGTHNVEMTGLHYRFKNLRQVTNPDQENTLRVYVAFNGVAGNAMTFYMEESTWKGATEEPLSRAKLGRPLENNDIDHITNHIRKMDMERIEGPLGSMRFRASGGILEMVGNDMYGVWKVEMTNGNDYRMFICNFDGRVVTQYIGTGGQVSFEDRSWFEGKYWLCCMWGTGDVILTPMTPIYLSQRPNMRFGDANFSLF